METKKHQHRSYLIKQIRIESEKSLENISSLTGIHTSILSEMERGKRQISDQNMIDILKACKQTFIVVDESAVGQLSDQIEEYFKNYYYMDFEKNIPLEKDLRENLNKRSNVYDDRYYYLLLLELFIQVRYKSMQKSGPDCPDFEKKIEILKVVHSIFPHNLDSIANMVLFQHYLDIRDLKNARLIMEDFRVGTYLSLNRMITTLVQYMDLKLSIEMGEVKNIYDLISVVRDGLIRDKNYHRLFNLDRLEAVYFMLIGNYEQADSSLEELQRSLDGMHLTFLRRSIFENRIWCTLMCSDFSKCLDLIDRFESSFSVDSTSNAIFKPYCMYRMNSSSNYEKELESLQTYQSMFKNDPDALKMVEIMQDLICGRTKTFYRKCLAYVNRLIKKENEHLAQLFIQIGYCKAEKELNYETMYKFQKLGQQLKTVRK